MTKAEQTKQLLLNHTCDSCMFGHGVYVNVVSSVCKRSIKKAVPKPPEYTCKYWERMYTNEGSQ